MNAVVYVHDASVIYIAYEWRVFACVSLMFVPFRENILTYWDSRLSIHMLAWLDVRPACAQQARCWGKLLCVLWQPCFVVASCSCTGERNRSVQPRVRSVDLKCHGRE